MSVKFRAFIMLYVLLILPVALGGCDTFPARIENDTSSAVYVDIEYVDDECGLIPVGAATPVKLFPGQGLNMRCDFSKVRRVSISDSSREICKIEKLPPPKNGVIQISSCN